MHQSANFPISLSRLIYDAESALREAETVTEDKCDCWVWNESSYGKTSGKATTAEAETFLVFGTTIITQFWGNTVSKSVVGS